MRQGLFAVLLILSAFAGGALINGPGLAWIREQLSRRDAPAPDELADGVPIPEVSGPLTIPAPDADPAPPRLPFPVANSSPFAPPSSTEGGPEARTPESRDAQSPAVPAPKGPSIASSTRPELPADEQTRPQSGPATGAPLPPPSLFDAARNRVPGRPIAQVSASSDEAETREGPADGQPVSPPQQLASGPAPPDDWTDSPDSAAPARPILPAADTSSPPAISRDEGLQKAGVSDSPSEGDWAEVRRRMEQLGVGRFWVEGEFGGPVVFRCVVPVIGDRAVSQHFEAEGSDLLAASQDALRRIALWRATESTP
ncbi:hypothetical protein [Tautonia plasticadhaerens]|uniref:hypothetical protein n=1 Tax=Tautonia plasticadhaerens TaxID=2527974 RepID=UPI0011A2CF18|nr:hypothetical protein [Tautonia plasticadhaerens]